MNSARGQKFQKLAEISQPSGSMGGVSDAHFALLHNRLRCATGRRGQRPFPRVRDPSHKEFLRKAGVARYLAASLFVFGAESDQRQHRCQTFADGHDQWVELGWADRRDQPGIGMLPAVGRADPLERGRNLRLSARHGFVLARQHRHADQQERDAEDESHEVGQSAARTDLLPAAQERWSMSPTIQQWAGGTNGAGPRGSLATRVPRIERASVGAFRNVCRRGGCAEVSPVFLYVFQPRRCELASRSRGPCCEKSTVYYAGGDGGMSSVARPQSLRGRLDRRPW
jgi:hypothetical protein